MSLHSTETWLPVGPAATAAGVARRSAFRWVQAGLIPVRTEGNQRCIEVNALRRLGEARQGATQPAQIRATPRNPDETATIPHPGLEDEALLALSVSMSNVEELLAGLVLRLGGIERMLRLRR